MTPFDKFFERYFVLFWTVGALIGLALTGVIIWAIIKFVLHFT